MTPLIVASCLVYWWGAGATLHCLDRAFGKHTDPLHPAGAIIWPALATYFGLRLLVRLPYRATARLLDRRDERRRLPEATVVK